MHDMAGNPGDALLCAVGFYVGVNRPAVCHAAPNKAQTE